MSFNPLGEWQPLYHLIYTLIYGCFYYAKFCLQYENCHLGEKSVYVYVTTLAEVPCPSASSVPRTKKFGNHCCRLLTSSANLHVASRSVRSQPRFNVIIQISHLQVPLLVQKSMGRLSRTKKMYGNVVPTRSHQR